MKTTFAVTALAFVGLVLACSSGPGTSLGAGSGSDPVPVSGDPATSSNDPSGSSSEGAGGASAGKCIACAGSFTCTKPGSDKTDTVTLTPAKGGLCDAEGLPFDPCTGKGSVDGLSATITAVGTGLHVCLTGKGKTQCIDCVPGAAPQPTPVVPDPQPPATPDAG